MARRCGNRWHEGGWLRSITGRSVEVVDTVTFTGGNGQDMCGKLKDCSLSKMGTLSLNFAMRWGIHGLYDHLLASAAGCWIACACRSACSTCWSACSTCWSACACRSACSTCSPVEVPEAPAAVVTTTEDSFVLWDCGPNALSAKRVEIYVMSKSNCIELYHDQLCFCLNSLVKLWSVCVQDASSLPTSPAVPSPSEEDCMVTG